MAHKRTVVIRWRLDALRTARLELSALDVQEKLYFPQLDGERWTVDDPDALKSEFRIAARNAATASTALRLAQSLIRKNRVSDYAEIERV